MGLSQEVRFKITGDTSGLRASFRQAESDAEKAGKKLEASIAKRIPKGVKPGSAAYEFWGPTPNEIKRLEKFKALATQERAEQDKAFAKGRRSGASGNPAGGGGGGGGDGPSSSQSDGASNFARYAFRAIGGAVAYGLRAVIEWNASRGRVEQAREQSGAAGLSSLRGTLAAIRGTRGQLEQGQATEKDLEEQRDYEKKRAEELRGHPGGISGAESGAAAGSAFGATGMIGGAIIGALGGPQGAVSKIAPGELEKSDKAVADLNAKIQEQHDANKLVERDLEQQNSLLKIQDDLLAETIERRGRGALSEVAITKMEEKRLQRSLAADEAAKRIFPDTPEYSRRSLEVTAAGSANLAARQLARQHKLDVQQELTSQAADGRTFANGRARPLSETERLARRAQQNRERARSRALTGAGGDIDSLLGSAQRDEASVAGRLSDATAGVRPKDVADSTSIKPEIVRSNQLLEAIKNSLAPVDLN